MNLSQIRSVVAGLHRYPGGVSTLLGADGTDLFLNAANNARRNLELKHNFEFSRLNAILEIDGLAGGALNTAFIEPSDGWINGGYNWPAWSLPQNAVVPQVVVSGTLTPSTAVGTYTQQGMLFGQPFYVFPIDASNDWALYYNPTVGSYVIAQTITNGALTDYWVNGTSGPTFAGTYTGNGASSGTATVANGSKWNGIKEVVAVLRRRPDGTYIPLDFARADIPIELDRTELEFADNLFPYLRYPSDAQINARGTNSAIIQRGKVLYIYPRYTSGVSQTFQCQLEAFGWLPDYTAADYLTENPDFIVEYGSDYLQWSIACELNYIYQTWVPRTEGNPGSPEAKLAAAELRLIDWDSYLVDSNTTRSR